MQQFRKSKLTKSILASSYKSAAHYCEQSHNSCSGADSQYDKVAARTKQTPLPLPLPLLFATHCQASFCAF